MAREDFMVKMENISFAITNQVLLSATSLTFESNRFHVIMGANGAGKSTLLKILAGHQKPSTGSVFIGDKNLNTFTKEKLARRRAVLSQHYHIAFPILVNDFVLMGRYPYYKNNPSPDDVTICKQAMQQMQVTNFSDRDYNTLSGGEAQKVQMSRVLAQVWPDEKEVEKILFLDEPVAHLDLKYQHQLLQVAKAICAKGVTVIAVLHDINLALSFADRILFMKNGAVCFDLQRPHEITSEIIQDIFDMPATVLNVSGHSKPVVIF
jgi:iron complex transport system ATP-binding protein